MRIIIVGAGDGFNYIDHFITPDTKVWAVSTIFPVLLGKTIDKVFDIHRSEKWKSFNYRSLGTKLVLPKFNPAAPKASIMPISNLEARYGVMFSSSVAWMVANALETPQVSEIVILGVDMEWRSEYEKQRDGLFFLLGFAKALGKEIIIPETSEINIFGKRYGYE